MMKTPSLSNGIRLAPLDDGYLAFDAENNKLHHLNATAALVVELCDGRRDLDTINSDVGAILSEASTDEVQLWIESAVQDGLLTYEIVTERHNQWLSAEELAEIAGWLKNEGRVEEAYQCQKKAAELAPDEPTVWYALGELAHIVGNRAEALRAYEEYLKFEPTDAEIQHILTALRDEQPPERASDAAVKHLYARFASFYEKNMCDDLGYRAPQILYDAVAPFLLEGNSQATVLDLGCGTGLSGALFRSHASALTGVDLSPEMISLAEKRGIYSSLHVAEITQWLKQDSASYNLILACDSLIYFGDLEQALKLASHRLKPGGLVAFTCETGSVMPFQLCDSGRYAHHPDHVHRAANGAGLSIVSLSECVLRQEYGESVSGLVTVAQAG